MARNQKTQDSYRHRESQPRTDHDWQPHLDTVFVVCKNCRIIRLCRSQQHTFQCLEPKGVRL